MSTSLKGALAQYHAAYDNQAFLSVSIALECFSLWHGYGIDWTHEHISLVLDTALERCGVVYESAVEAEMEQALTHLDAGVSALVRAYLARFGAEVAHE